MKKKQPECSPPSLLNELALHETIIEQTIIKKNPTTEEKVMGGTHLNWIRENIKSIPELRNQYGSFINYAETKYNYAKSTACNYTNVARRFSTCNEIGNLTGILKPEFKAFDHAQLIEMERLTDEEITKITPDMSVREIIEFRTGEAPSQTISCKSPRKELHKIIETMTDEQYEIMQDFANRLVRV